MSKFERTDIGGFREYLIGESNNEFDDASKAHHENTGDILPSADLNNALRLMREMELCHADEVDEFLVNKEDYFESDKKEIIEEIASTALALNFAWLQIAEGNRQFIEEISYIEVGHNALEGITDYQHGEESNAPAKLAAYRHYIYSIPDVPPLDD